MSTRNTLGRHKSGERGPAWGESGRLPETRRRQPDALDDTRGSRRGLPPWQSYDRSLPVGAGKGEELFLSSVWLACAPSPPGVTDSYFIAAP